MKDYVIKRVILVSNYIIKNKTTIRATAKHFNVSKATIQMDISERLLELNKNLYDDVRKVMEYNKSVRHIRGGQATKRLYKH